MGIQPIDLQILFTQLEKVGKTEGGQQQLQASQLKKQQQANVQDAENRRTSVQKSEAKEQVCIHDGGGNGKEFAQNTPHKKPEKKSKSEDIQEYIQDPALGRKVDVSG